MQCATRTRPYWQVANVYGHEVVDLPYSKKTNFRHRNMNNKKWKGGYNKDTRTLQPCPFGIISYGICGVSLP